MTLDKALDAVRDAEAELAGQLRTIGERHAAEHDIYHLGHTLARQCASRVERLAGVAERYGASLAVDGMADSAGLLAQLRQKGPDLLGRSPTSALLLLRDLRVLYLAAQDTELAWVILLQTARAVRDPQLLAVATACHAEAETRAKWVRTRIKESAPQTYAT